MDVKITKAEWDGELAKFRMSLTTACDAVLIKTGVVLNPKSVRTHLERYGHLSPAQSATFRFLFSDLARTPSNG